MKKIKSLLLSFIFVSCMSPAPQLPLSAINIASPPAMETIDDLSKLPEDSFENSERLLAESREIPEEMEVPIESSLYPQTSPYDSPNMPYEGSTDSPEPRLCEFETKHKLKANLLHSQLFASFRLSKKFKELNPQVTSSRQKLPPQSTVKYLCEKLDIQAPRLTTTFLTDHTELCKKHFEDKYPTRHTYKVKKGESLIRIAKAQWNSHRHWPLLYCLNSHIISHYDRIPVGLVIELPSRDQIRR